jgi:hypothetical protein
MRKDDLGERPTSRKDLAAWYSAALDAQARSGLSVSDYAEQIGVTGWTLYDWRRRLGGGGVRDRGKLVEVTVARSMGAEGGGGMVVRVGDGRRSIEVPRGFDGDDLRRLVAVLESC